MENKHTPGPWWVSEEENEVYTIGAGDYPLATVEPIESLKDYRQYFPGGKGQANAHLMKAAPDMLEALEALTERAKFILRHINDEELEGRVYEARAAIAKAKGLPQ